MNRRNFLGVSMGVAGLLMGKPAENIPVIDTHIHLFDPAPHKPLLLLVLCDLVEKGNLPRDTLPLTPELAFRFYTYWSIVAGRRPLRKD